MNYSNIYLFYPNSMALEHAITQAVGLFSDELVKAAAPDTSVTVVDKFRQTRGNYEQHRYSSNILDSAREALEALLTDDYRAQQPLAWAQTQNSLGNIFAAQGQQLREAQLFEKAIQCFNLALEEYSQEESPREWAATQYNLATAKQALGRQQGDVKLLKSSIEDYTTALLQWSKKETPEEWARAMHQLGATFHTYGSLLKGNRTFQKSVVAYKNALSVFDADNHAFELAAAHNNCGAVLQHLAESEENAERMEEAIRSYETALTVCMEQQLPIHLAVLCKVNRSTARCVQAEFAKDPALAEEVADEFELIIECFPHALQPLCLKHCNAQMNKARSLSSAVIA